MKKSKENINFQNLTEWLGQRENDTNFSKSINKIVKKDQVPVNKDNSGAAVKPFSANVLNSNNSKPKIELEKDGNLISAIKITCACGEVINIDLDYDDETQSLVIDD